MATDIKLDVRKAVYDDIDTLEALKDSAKGKTIMITGAGRGIGQAIAVAFAQASAKALVLTALEKSELEETKKIVQSIRPGILVFYSAIDVRDASAVEHFVRDSATWSGGVIDVLCSNAGISPPLLTIAECDHTRWWMGIEVNLKGSYLFSHYVLPIMQKQGHGHIIITASRAAAMVAEKITSYSVSKLAVTRLAECIHEENYNKGIKCFAIHPGGIITRLLTDIETKETEGWAKEAATIIRPMLTDDISLPGNSCVYLASGKADFLSGRYVDLTIGFDNIEKNKEAIIEHDLFKTGIALNWTPSGGGLSVI
ncbi:hypothetical protein LTR99_001010 [Exophiala xenobiotica]|uniref:Uncharacterized protein n=1 Tax=Vermiconidia calcicola TaxID=1690605 RepID=A0AAV9QLP4_9PEZI|nr:hypothetical protein LTR41_005716 [Exophiala xenobiotica]KAK5534857.1 hypothetical protein LTR23_008653 [Chaetothyriales sp. CCFEE 6169]KAK5545573.1 hypothetical protein LTR25_000580 [Vermiconidia calcicola]KAK5271830.1 hypothetical protein LTR96_003658 [Exophiala xenobiotica]KAK5308038.1 hypothetical protein LTR99_001010 [Exophiala xenobiotica]